jgi:hypothetical protein
LGRQKRCNQQLVLVVSQRLLFPFMPLFASASGLQITGGTFIDNAGDININTTQLQFAQAKQ